jgi:hypothetical protein
MNSNYALRVKRHYQALCKHYANQLLLLIIAVCFLRAQSTTKQYAVIAFMAAMNSNYYQ